MRVNKIDSAEGVHAGPASVPARWSSLVPLHGGGALPPLFCLHDASGDVSVYRSFAGRLGDDRPVYGLRARGLGVVGEPHTSIEEMARAYLEEVRAKQPEEPYILAGYGHGGVIAYEMARQLEAAGHTVAVLAMIDGAPPPNRRNLLGTLGYVAEALRTDPLGALAYALGVEIPARLERRGRMRPGPGATPDRMVPASWLVSRALDAAYASYRPEPYQGNIDSFVNSERARLPEDGWSELAAGGVRRQVFTGEANAAFREPALSVLAEQVRAILSRAQASRGRGR